MSGAQTYSMSLEALHKKFPWNSINRFMPIATKHGFSKEDVTNYFKQIARDKLSINHKQYYLPIFSNTPDAYQFDTLITRPPMLVFINVNSRKAYAYPMRNKGTSEVLRCLEEFVNEAHPQQLTSDQDPAYLSQPVIDYMLKNNIDYHTTEDNNHNILGIINRFIKTLRDHVEDINNIDAVRQFINIYNNQPHTSTGIAPNKFTNKDEVNYIMRMSYRDYKVREQNDYKLKIGDKVRIVYDNKPLQKKRTNLSKEHYIIDSIEGNGYVIKAKDESIAYYPRHKLVKDNSGPLAETLDDGKRGIVREILEYYPKSDKYKVVYTDNSVDTIKAKNLRETNPTSLGPLERDYWKNKNDIPSRIAAYA